MSFSLHSSFVLSDKNRGGGGWGGGGLPSTLLYVRGLNFFSLSSQNYKNYETRNENYENLYPL